MNSMPPFDFPASQSAEVIRVATAGDDSVVGETFHLAVETPLSLDIADVAVYTVMCSPLDIEALALGFLFSQGMIARASDVASMERDSSKRLGLRIHLKTSAAAASKQRHFMIVSAGGLSGSQDYEPMLAGLPRVTDTLRVTAERLRLMSEAMRKEQLVYPKTGGTHAAALFAVDGQEMAFAEDIGRHNALDKAVGKCLAAGRTTAGGGAALSGRVSFEMVAKCAQAGLELITAVSAPTSLAVEAADQCGITLCAFVREDRATVFTFPHRILGLSLV